MIAAGMLAPVEVEPMDAPAEAPTTAGRVRIVRPDEINRPEFRTWDDWFRFEGDERDRRPGLWWHGWGKATGNGDAPPVDEWVCSPIHAIATTAGEDGSDWGLLLRFRDPDRRWKEWAAPLRLLRGSGEDLRGELLDLGVRIDPRHRNLLTQWLMAQYPADRITAASRTGWHRGRRGFAFVLPGRTVGDETVRYQAESMAHDDYRTAGTLEAWRERVARPCAGNPVLLLAASAAFAGPLLEVARLQEVGGVGLHLLGDSSRGKTTALQVAASVWAGPGYVRTWRSTANGLEGAAVERNDTLMVLDEISECDPREIGAVIYMLANGVGKQRATRTGGSRPVARWRSVLLSSGETTLQAHMAEGGRRAKAGQEARLLDIPVTGRVYGVFDELGHHGDGRAFADALKQATAIHYGHAGPEFVAHMIADRRAGRDFPALLAQYANDPAFAAVDGLEMRAAGVFALVALAGELATEYGLTGWDPGAASEAAAEMFCVWREHRGTGSTEDRRILDGIRDFLLAHGDSRFSDVTGHNGPLDAIRGRAGWYRHRRDGDSVPRTYYITSSALREAAPGFEVGRIADALDRAGWIVDRDTDRPSRRTKKIKLPDGSTVRLYAIRPAGADDG